MLDTRITGQVVAAKTATFKDDSGMPVEYGKIQMLTKDMSGDFFALTNIKVKRDNFSWITNIAKLVGKQATLSLDQQMYNGKSSLYLSAPIELK